MPRRPYAEAGAVAVGIPSIVIAWVVASDTPNIGTPTVVVSSLVNAGIAFLIVGVLVRVQRSIEWRLERAEALSMRRQSALSEQLSAVDNKVDALLETIQSDRQAANVPEDSIRVRSAPDKQDNSRDVKPNALAAGRQERAEDLLTDSASTGRKAARTGTTPSPTERLATNSAPGKRRFLRSRTLSFIVLIILAIAVIIISGALFIR